jgi:integrase
LALLLGLRRGELEAGTLTVRQNLVRAGGQLRIQAPKTRRSRRMLPLPRQVQAALRRQRASQAAERLAAGSSWADNGLVFTTSLGTPIEPTNLTRHFYRVRDRAGLPQVRFHDLRHTCLTLLQIGGVASGASFGRFGDCCWGGACGFALWSRVVMAAVRHAR